MFIFNTKLENKKASNGVVTFDATIASFKVHEFSKDELYNHNVPSHIKDKTIKIDFKKEAFDLESFGYLPITRNHPPMLLGKMNKKSDVLKYVGVGVSASAEADEKTIKSKVSILDSDMLSEIANDNNHLSWGGMVKIAWNSEEDIKKLGYHGYLEKAKGDHVAIVVDGDGRCGKECSIKNSKNSDDKDDKIENVKNKEEGKKMQILLNGKKVEVDEELATQIETAVKAVEEERDSLINDNKELKQKAEKFDKIVNAKKRSDCLNMAKKVNSDIENHSGLGDMTLLDIANKALNKQYDNEELALSVLREVSELKEDEKEDEEVYNSFNHDKKDENVEDVYADFYKEEI